MVITAVHSPEIVDAVKSKKFPWLNRYLQDCGWRIEYDTLYHLGASNIKDLLEDYIFNEQPESHSLPALHWTTKEGVWVPFK